MQGGKSWLVAAVMLTACMAAVSVRGQPDGTETELASRVEMLVWETRFGGMSDSTVRAKAPNHPLAFCGHDEPAGSEVHP
jgi:hypothetical protein